MYKIGEWAKVDNDFQNCFGVSISPFYDGLLSLIFKRVVINLVKFDEWLESTYPDEWKNTAMFDILLHHYGQKGVSIIKTLI